jgi:hypothetical protein
MDRLFSPCTRMRDKVESQRLSPPEGLQELYLDVSSEELLGADKAFTYADLYAMLGDQEKVAWLTPHAAIARQSKRVVSLWYHMDVVLHFSFSADGKDMCALVRSPEHLLEICDVVLRLLAASVVHSVTLHNWHTRNAGVQINSAILAYLMGQCQSLKVLTLTNIEMDENHCRVLGAFSRPDLEIVLDRCNLTSALAEAIGRNQ